MKRATPDELIMASVLLNRHEPLQLQQVQALHERLGCPTDDDLVGLIRTGNFSQITEPTSPMFYVAEDPKQPGTAFASCVDKPEFAKSTAKDVAAWIKRGAIVRRVDGPTMHRMISSWKQPE